MTKSAPSFPYFTWDCADELEGRLKKTLYHGGTADCMAAVSSAALADLAVSVYLAAAPSPKRKLRPGYIGSISKRLSINPCTMMLGILYCERMRQINPDYLNKISSSDLFVVSLVVASKFLNDEGEDDEIFNDEWAEAGGLGVSTINRLEREFLNAMQWRAYVSPKEFLQFCNKLETRIALKNGLDRGWFSYTDLTNILAQIQFIDALMTFLQKVFQIMASCTVVYGLSVGVLLSTAICINAAANAKDMIGNTGGISDPVHPFTNRQITRIRQTPMTTQATDDGMQCSCEVASQQFEKPWQNENMCKCPKVAEEDCSKAVKRYLHWSQNSSTVFTDLGHATAKEERPKANQRAERNTNNELRAYEILENTAFPLMVKLKNSDIASSKNCQMGNRIFDERLLGFLNVFGQRKNMTNPSRRIFHETLFPLEKFPTVDNGLFYDKSFSFLYSGPR